MKVEMLASLRGQAECLLMKVPGQYEYSPIDFCKQQITESYQYYNRNPPKDIHGERLRLGLLTWLAACEWWSILGPKEEPEPIDYGVFSISGTERHRQLKVYCHDYTHFKYLPVQVVYRGMDFGRILWDAATRRATYRNDVFAGSTLSGIR